MAAAAAASVVRRAAVASPLPRGGSSIVSGITSRCAAVKPARPAPSFTPRRFLHDGATKEEVKGVEARLKDEIKVVDARINCLELNMGNPKEIMESVKHLERQEIVTGGKVFKLEVISADQSGKIMEIKEVQGRQQVQFESLKDFVDYQTKVSADDISQLHGHHTKLVVQMTKTTHNFVLSGCAGLATLFLGGLQVYTLLSNNKTEELVDARVNAKLKQCVEAAVEAALAKNVPVDPNGQ